MVDSQEYLRQKCFEGLEKRGFAENQKYIERLNYELNIIESGNLADFFLNTAYICLKIKNNGVMLGLGRGSVGGCLVAYCLKITEINPIKHNLLFERFLNPTRINEISSADIDTDIPRSKRQDVLKMMKSEFGTDKTYQIINKIQWTEKTAIKDLARIIDIPFQVVNRLTNLIDETREPEDVEEVANFLNKYPFIKENYKKLVGMTKNYGIHAGGVITLDRPVEHYDSILKINGVECLDNNGKTCDYNGFLKNDLLGLTTLDIISNCLSLIPNASIPEEYNDPKVFKTINESTLGVFQIEAAGATDVCKRLKPNSFEELCLVVALCRPGAMDSGDTDRYINRKHGLEEVKYDHPNLKPILEENLGAIVYQEDVMHIVTEFAGMSPADANEIRRGIGKKIQEVFDEYHPKFISSCEAKGIENDVAEKIWKKMEASGSYSFNKAHCVSYTALSYICGWLKTYYPIEYFTAMLNTIDDENKRMLIYGEIKNIGKNLINPDINLSKAETIYDDENIYLSFSLIKGIGDSVVNEIVRYQPYLSFDDFMHKKSSKVGEGVCKALIESGAFDSFTSKRDKLMSILTGEQYVWDEKEKLYHEFDRIKINPKSNMLDLYDVGDLGISRTINTVKDLKENVDYNDFFIKLLPSSFKKKDDHAYVSMTDGYDTLSVFVPKELMGMYIDSLKSIGTPLLCHLNGKGEKYSLLSLIKLQEPEENQKEYWFYTGEAIEKVKQLQEANPGYNCGVASNVKYFISKSGNPCIRYDMTIADGTVMEGRVKVFPEYHMMEGSFVFFNIGDNPVFLDIVQVV